MVDAASARMLLSKINLSLKVSTHSANSGQANGPILRTVTLLKSQTLDKGACYGIAPQRLAIGKRIP